MIGSTLKLPDLSHFSSTNVNSASQGLYAVAAVGAVTNIDLKLLDDCFLTGGVLRTEGSSFGDYATFQVVDVDNILGYGANTILGQYVTSWYMRSDAQEQVNENTPYPAKVIAGLYLRLVYTSMGSSAVNVAVMYRLHRALY
jgi:hypothetical protein